MAEFLAAAFGVPTMVLTTALAAVVGFWSLVLCGVVTTGVFDADVDAEALGLGDVPVAAAGSVFIVVGWVLDLSGMLLLGRAGLAGAWSFPLSVVLFASALAFSWQVTRWLTGRWAGASSADPRSSARRCAGSVRAAKRTTVPRRVTGQRSSRITA
jgi:hypothetical protein